MRVIGGTFKGRRIQLPKNIPARPTTDFGREGLFNVLIHNYPQHEGSILELFAGSGMVALEFISRGAKEVLSIDKHPVCINHLRKISKEFHPMWSVLKKEVFYFLSTNEKKFDLVFADPPYNLPNLKEIPQAVFNLNTLTDTGLLIVEHPAEVDFTEETNFVMHKKYGNVNFSFFSCLPNTD